MYHLDPLDYIVENRGTTWAVRLSRGLSALSFRSRRQAMADAVRHARRVRRLGHVIHVWVRRNDGTLRKVPDRLLAA